MKKYYPNSSKNPMVESEEITGLKVYNNDLSKF